MELTSEQRTELESVLQVGYDGSVSARAQMVLWRADGFSAAEVATMAGTTKPTVYLWTARFAQGGVAALESGVSTGRPRSVSAQTRARIVALTKLRPPVNTGLTHWSSYEMARYLKRCEGISVGCGSFEVSWLRCEDAGVAVFG